MFGWLKKRAHPAPAQTESALSVAVSDITVDPYKDLVLEAKTLHEARQWLEAADLYDKILAESPGHADALLGRGQLLAEARHFDLAADYVRRSLAASGIERPLGTLNALAMIELELNHVASADALAMEVLAKLPDNAQALVIQGNVHRLAGRQHEATAAYEAALKSNPNHINGLFAYAKMAQNAAQYVKAAALYERLHRLVPTHGAICGDYALSLIHSGRTDLGFAKLHQAVLLDPQNVNGWVSLVQALFASNRIAEARQVSDDAVKNGVVDIRLVQARGDLLSVSQDYVGAAKVYEDGLSLATTDEERVHMLMARAVVFHRLGDEAGGLALFEEAEALCVGENEKHLPMLRYNRSELRLIQGDFALGMKDYDYRFEAVDFLKKAPVLPKSLWDGQTDLSHRSILVWMEQGIGDEIHFCRYAAELKRRYPAAIVIFGARPSTARLMKTLEGVDQVVVLGVDPDPVTDFHVPVISLVGLLGVTVSTIDPSPYLSVDDALRSKWSQRLGPRQGRLRVGVVWAGSPMADRPGENARDKIRSLPLKAILPILEVPDIDFYSLQVYASPQGKSAPPTVRPRLPAHVIDLTADISDFADTAALISQLDLVIGVDTSTVHCAGAIGCPVWLLNRKNTCWRWFNSGDYSPWYRNFRIFRQETLGEWAPVIDAAASELARYARECQKDEAA